MCSRYFERNRPEVLEHARRRWQFSLLWRCALLAGKSSEVQANQRILEETTVIPLGIWWRIVEKYRVTIIFTSLAAIRTLKRQDSEISPQI
jgi:hypothetical protein